MAEQQPVEVWSAGAPVSDAHELVRRYCGLPDETGRVEIWGYEFYDVRPQWSDVEVSVEDVTATSALNMRFTRSCLEGWMAARPAIRDVLSGLPPDLILEDATDEHLESLEWLITGLIEGNDDVPRVPDTDRGMVTKVLHLKRPRLIALYDRVIADRYARGLGDKRYGRGIDLVRAIREDMRDPRTAKALREIQARLAVDLDGRTVPSRLRLFDIAIWMDARGRS